MSRGRDFAELVHRILVNDGRYSLATVASGMGMLYETLYARVRNRTYFSADEIRALIKIVPDVRLIAYFLDGTNIIAVERPARVVSDTETDLLSAAHQLVFGASDVLKLVESASDRRSLDRRDSSALEGEIFAVEKTLLALRDEVRRRQNAR